MGGVLIGAEKSASLQAAFNLRTGEFTIALGEGEAATAGLFAGAGLGGSVGFLTLHSYSDSEAMMGPAEEFSMWVGPNFILSDISLVTGVSSEAYIDPQTGALKPAYDPSLGATPKMGYWGVAGGAGVDILPLPLQAGISNGVSNTIFLYTAENYPWNWANGAPILHGQWVDADGNTHTYQIAPW